MIITWSEDGLWAPPRPTPKRDEFTFYLGTYSWEGPRHSKGDIHLLPGSAAS